jgi:hypothetical protein
MVDAILVRNQRRIAERCVNPSWEIVYDFQHGQGGDKGVVNEPPQHPSPDSKIEILTRLELYFSVRHTARTMRLFAEVLDFDYDCVVIFLSVAEICFQAAFHLAPINVGPRDIENLYSQFASSGLSIMTIAEITGIPRETVRRKVKKLVDDRHLAISQHTKNVYLPVSVVLSQTFFDRFKSHMGEATQLVKSIAYYQK